MGVLLSLAVIATASPMGPGGIRPIFYPGILPVRPDIKPGEIDLKPFFPVRPGADDNGLPPVPVIPGGDGNGLPPVIPGGDGNGLPPVPVIPGGDGNGLPPVIPGGDGNGLPPKPIIGGPDGIRPQPQDLTYPICPAHKIVYIPVSELERNQVIHINEDDKPII